MHWMPSTACTAACGLKILKCPKKSTENGKTEPQKLARMLRQIDWSIYQPAGCGIAPRGPLKNWASMAQLGWIEKISTNTSIGVGVLFGKNRGGWVGSISANYTNFPCSRLQKYLYQEETNWSLLQKLLFVLLKWWIKLHSIYKKNWQYWQKLLSFFPSLQKQWSTITFGCFSLVEYSPPPLLTRNRSVILSSQNI